MEDLTCNCKKSKCLKLYCQCFAARAFCQGTCKCTMCSNSADNIDAINHAVSVITERNPSAFECKFMEGGSKEDVVHKIGCRCRKSMCLKKYCECFQAQIACSDSCICLDCCNTLETVKDIKPDVKPVAFEPVSKKRPTPDSIMKAVDNLTGLRIKKGKTAAGGAAIAVPSVVDPIPIVSSSAVPATGSRSTKTRAAGRPPVHPNSRKVETAVPLGPTGRGGSFSPIVNMPDFGTRAASPNSMHCAWALALLVGKKDGEEGEEGNLDVDRLVVSELKEYDSGLGTDTVTTDEETSVTSSDPMAKEMELTDDLDSVHHAAPVRNY
jgi:hypothetical protein